jgi:hypothetical protein
VQSSPVLTTRSRFSASICRSPRIGCLDADAVPHEPEAGRSAFGQQGRTQRGAAATGWSACREAASARRAVGIGYVGGRSLYNPLTFAVVDVGRRTYGASGRFAHASLLSTLNNKLTAGFDLQSQNDLRRNFANCNNVPPLAVATATCPVLGAEGGTVTLDQRELVSSAGAY